MESTIAAKDELQHFTHNHPLSLVHLQQPYPKNKNDDDDEDDDEDKDDFVEEEHHHGGECNMCKERIWSFHLCYYKCRSCDYSLHKFCAELPRIHQNHPLHPSHKLHLSFSYELYHMCFACKLMLKDVYFYVCLECHEYMDIVCATMSEHKINHPSHPHQLERMSWPIVSRCVACGKKHEGVFFHCASCPRFWINLDCALLPAKLLIQDRTNGNFTHCHPLTLAYSFLISEMRAKIFPYCRVCGGEFYSRLWIYKCDKCRYYVHVDCSTSKREPFMSIFLHASLGKTIKIFKEDEHPNLLRCPFLDEGDNLLKHHITNQKLMIGEQHDGEMLSNSSHQHPLVLFDKATIDSKENTVTLHNPMKKNQLLCDGCVKPIMDAPIYMCGQYVDGQCCFVLHEWCAKLPSQVQDYMGHPEHTLFLLPKIPTKFFRVFECKVCHLPSNGFAYGCTMCEFYIDINCAFIPEEITHDAHQDHLLSKIKSSSNVDCKACGGWTYNNWVFHCPFCDIYIHVECALLSPRVIKHKCDEHPLSLRYEPVENHPSEYFCEICDPWRWFYHCTKCAQSMHAVCVPLILQCEQASSIYNYWSSVYVLLNVKFGGTLEIKGHTHRLSFVEGIKSDGECTKCHFSMQYKMIFKCFECKFAFHYECASSFIN